MKNIRAYIGTAILVAVFLLTPVAVSAQTTADNTAENNADTTQTNKEKTTPKERLDKYKQAYAAKLSVAQEARLKARCKQAQTKGKSLGELVTKNNTARTTNYKKVTTSLENITAKLKDAGVDTAKLEEQRTQLQKLIDTYNTDLEQYQTTITDMSEVDCTVDPAGFKSALEAARAARAVVAKDAQAIRSYIKDTIKVTLADIKTDLAKDDTANDSPATTEGAQ